MVIDLVITGFKSRQYDSKAGKKTAHDLFAADSDPSPVTRMSSEMMLVLDDEEYAQVAKLKKVDGATVKVALKQFVEMRNGLPKVRASVIQWPKD